MPVRLSESRIPEGLSPSDLGPADTETAANVKLALVSYLPKITRFEREIISENTYVVFVEGAATPESVQYRWTIEGFIEEKNGWVLGWQQITEGDYPILRLENKLSRDITCFSLMSKLRITVFVTGVDSIPVKLEITQDIHRTVKKVVDKPVAASKGSAYGNPELTERIMGYYGEYFEALRSEPGFEDRNHHRRVQLVVARVYAAYLNNFEDQNRSDYLWEQYFTDRKVADELPWQPLGVAWIYPPIFAMFVSANVLGSASPALVTPMLRREDFTGDLDAYIQQLFSHLNGLSDDHKIDLYNVLRFPKSCIRACSMYFERLKYRHTSWRSITWNDFLNESITDKNYIRHLLDEFWQGPTDQPLSRFEHDSRTLDMFAKRYIYLASATNKCLLLRTEDMSVTLTLKEEDTAKKEALDELNNASAVDLYNRINSQELGGEIRDENAKWEFPLVPEIYYDLTRFVCTYVVQFDDPPSSNFYSIIMFRHEWTGEEWQTHSIPALPAGEGGAQIRKRAARNRVHVAYELARYIEEIDGNYFETTDPAALPAGLEKIMNRLQLAIAFEQASLCLGPREGVVDTSSTANKVTWVSGDKFNLGWPDLGMLRITINGVNYLIASVDADTQLTLSSSPGNQTGVEYKVVHPFAEVSKQSINFMKRYLNIIENAHTFPFNPEHLSEEMTSLKASHPNEQFISYFSEGELPDFGASMQSAGSGHIPKNEDYPVYKTADYFVIPMEFILDKPETDTDSATTTLTEPTQIDALIDYLREWVARALPKLKLLLVGYADKSFIGPGDRESYNLNLSQDRVDWIIKQLPDDLKEALAKDAAGDPYIVTQACGDKYSELPEQNAKYREVRVLLYPEEVNL